MKYGRKDRYSQNSNSPRKDESAAMTEKVQIIADEMQPHRRPVRIISMKDTLQLRFCPNNARQDSKYRNTSSPTIHSDIRETAKQKR